VSRFRAMCDNRAVLATTSASKNQRPAIPFEVTALIVAISEPVILARQLAAGTSVGFGGNWEQVSIARSLVAGHGFANPFSEYVTGPTAICAPLHPAMLAAILLLSGDRPAFAIAALLAEAAIQVACLLLLLRISTIAFSSWIPGAVAAVAMLLCTRPSPQWENATAWLAMEAIFLCVLAGCNAGWSGLVTGLGWLVSPALVFASIAAAFFLRGWKHATATTALAVLVVAPWVARNWSVFHSPIFLRDNYGLELFISNNDLAGPKQADVPERYPLLHPSQNAAMAGDLVRLGEPQYFGRMQRETVRWIQEHPAQFARLTFLRIWNWWFSNWIVAWVGVLGFAGLWMNRASPLGRAAAAILLLFPLPYYVVQFDPRYAWPSLWLSALMAGYACWAGVRRLRDTSQLRRETAVR